MCRTTLRLRPTRDDRLWDDLVIRHRAGTAFHLSRFLSTAAPLLGQRAHLTLAEADGQIVGVVPMLVRPMGPLLLVNCSAQFPYLGPLLPPGFSMDTVLAAVQRHFRPRQVLDLGIQSTDSIAVPDRRGWTPDDVCSAILTVGDKDDDALLGLLAPNQRRRLRRAAEEGIVASPATRREVVEHLPPLVNDTLARNGVRPSWPASSHLRFYDVLAPTGVCLATAARRDGKVLAISLDMLLGRRLVGWQIGISEEGRALGASPVLATAVMRRARNMGAIEFDMLGAPTPGIASYKRSLGAEFRPRTAAHWTAPWLPPHSYLRRLSALPLAARMTRPGAGPRR
jgi:CelD/BcsL family acetyltransferase involved in cellulose biosynthesis